MSICGRIKQFLLVAIWFGTGCALWDDSSPKKVAPPGLITTPASYYSTQKARYLGTKYQDNLDRLAERILRNSTTSQLQFANNISSVGGIGFFTHSATKTADERYLEVVLSTPETFETKGEYSEKVNRLFSRFGHDLLAILAGDTQIYQDQELSGYGLNLTWRLVVPDAPANRITMARAIVYFNKERVSRFLRKEMGQSELLGDAVIFAMEEDGQLNLVSYQPRETKPDFRPAIREDNLVAGATESKPSTQPAIEPKQAVEPKIETTQKEFAAAAETKPRPTANPIAVAEKTETPLAAKKELPLLPRSAEELPSTKLDTGTDGLTAAEPSAETAVVSPVPKGQPQPVMTVRPQSGPTPSASSTVRSTSSDTNQVDKTNAGDSAAAITPVKAPLEQKLPAKPVEVQKAQAASKPLNEMEKSAQPVGISKASIEVAKPEIKAQEVAPVPVVIPSAVLPAFEEKASPQTLAVATVKSSEPPAKKSTPAPVSLTSGETEKVVKPAQPAITPPASSKSEEVTRAAADTVSPAPIAEVVPSRQIKSVEPAVKEAAAEKPLAAKDRPVASPTAAIAKISPQSEPVAKNLTTEPTIEPQTKSPPAIASTEKAAPAISSAAPTAGFAKAAENKIADTQAVNPAPVKSPELSATRKLEQSASQLAALPQSKVTNEAVARSSVEKLPDKVAPALGPTKVEAAQTIKPEAKTPLAAPVQENTNDKPEQLALLRKPVEPSVEKPPVARPALKPLEGFIIQVAFNDKGKAQSWAEKMQQRGYAVSVTEAGPEGSLRVRLGNFAIRDEAERQLRNFKQDGLSGIIINLPQAFRPEARSSLP